MRFTVHISVCVFLIWSTVTSGEEKERDTKPLSVLLITGYFPGHLFSVVSLGEELVKRGHNVTLCTTVMEGSHLLPKVPERVGITFVSAGPDNLTQEGYDNMSQEFLEPQLKFDMDVIKVFAGVWTVMKIRQTVEKIGLEQFDIIVCDGSTLYLGAYYAKLGQKVVLFSSLIPHLPATEPEWPASPVQTTDATFGEKMATIFIFPMYRILLRYLSKCIRDIDREYDRVVQDTDVLSYPGIRIPLFITTVFGFDFPKTQTPLTHYIGPVLMGTLPPLDPDTEEWLNEKKERSVIYISMGTSGVLTANMAEAIVEGVLATDYDAVWALRKSNRDILEGLQINHDRLYIADWIPQQTVLTHPAIGLTILHCGMNGAQESLYNSLPIICIPYVNDQSEVALRVEKSGTGIAMYGFLDFLRGKRVFSAQNITDAINTLSSGLYRENAAKIRKLFQHAGGAQRAADLVEFYEEVGYDHLIPAYAKYEWSWVQYYNVDVYCLLVAILTLWLYVSYRILKCCLRICCTGKKKTKQE